MMSQSLPESPVGWPIKSHVGQLICDENGFVVSTELIILATVVVLGLLAGFSALRDSVVSELSDVSGAVQDFNMSFSLFGISSPAARTAGSEFVDARDFCDEPGDPVGEIDNCIEMSEPIDEGTAAAEPTGSGIVPKEVVLSEASDLTIDSTVNGTGGSATGTLGDGTIDTNFTVTTDTGNITGDDGDEIRFSEDPSDTGTFTITFDDPVTEFEFWLRNFTNITGNPDHLIGNFTLELSDGTIINNAAFNVLPDAIAPNSNFGEFSTGGVSRELVVPVNVGGLDYVTDPTFNGSGSQAAGRIVFPDIPSLGGAPGPGSVGLRSIQFDKVGGVSGFNAFFGASGQVIHCPDDP
jgi:hypothetical protein